MGQEASGLCPIGRLTESGRRDLCTGHVTNARMTHLVLSVMRSDTYKIAQARSVPLCTAQKCEKKSPNSGRGGSRVRNRRSHDGRSHPSHFFKEAVQGVKGCRGPSAWEIIDILQHVTQHSADTQLAHSWPSESTVAIATSEMCNGAGAPRQEKKTLALMGRQKEEVMMRPAVPMIPCVAWQEGIHQ